MVTFSHFSIWLVVLVVPWLHFSSSKPNPNSTRVKEKNFGFTIPAFLLGNNGGIGNVNPNGINNGNLPNVNSNTNSVTNQNTGANLGNNIFRQVTVTRTILSTVATITVPVFRTCTALVNNIPSCMGRRRRSAGNEAGLLGTAISATKVTRQPIVTESFHIPQIVIVSSKDDEGMGKDQSKVGEEASTTLYASPDYAASVQEEFENDRYFQDLPTTGLVTSAVYDGDYEEEGQARINLIGTTTVIRTVPVTAIVNSTVTGAQNNLMVTLSITYGGCIPPSLPVTGTQC